MARKKKSQVVGVYYAPPIRSIKPRIAKCPPPDLSEYRGMWLFVMFDLPVKEPEERKEYALFRKKLLQLGFTRLQYSIYARYFASEEASEIQRKKVKGSLPPDGFVRILSVTDRQFGKMEAFIGKKLTETEVPPRQLAFF